VARRRDTVRTFLGARQEIVERVVELLKEQHPALEIAGYRKRVLETGPKRAEVVAGDQEAAATKCLFVAMGSPKKEIFLNKWKAELQTPFVMGVGGDF